MSKAWRWVKHLAPAWKAITVLGAAILLGMTLGGWMGLPARVDANEECCEENRSNCTEAQRDIKLILILRLISKIKRKTKDID